VLVVGLGALARGLRRLPRQRMQDLPPELGSILSAAVREDDDTERLLRDKGDVGRVLFRPPFLSMIARLPAVMICHARACVK
jgi:hypothetical protein